MSLFTIADVATLKADRLLRVAESMFPDAMPSDDYILFKLQAEEANLEQRTRTCFGVREILPSGANDAERAALEATGAVILDEPGYDYDPGLFMANTWGLIALRHKPILDVHSIVMAYPSADSVLFTIPKSWVRPEKKYGRLNLVPASDTAINFPANAYIMSTLGGGRVIPLMLQVRYSVGMPNLRTERPDILDLIFKMTVYSILEDQYLPASGSDSLDGLSQSLSFDASKYKDLLDARIEKVSQSLNGIRFMVL
ncbi:MAG TPA: hypothetical protein VGC15_16580 [Acetobacteraceae bacterium]